MVGSIRRSVVGPLVAALSVFAALGPVPSASAQAPAGPAAKKADAPVAAPAVSPSTYFGLTGEEPPTPFVPLKPRTLEDRKRVEALTDFSAARGLQVRGNLVEAIGLLEHSLALEPDSVNVLRRLSTLCFVLGRTEQGIKYSKRALAVDPSDSDSIIRLVNFYTSRRGDLASAEALLNEVLANPKLEAHAPGRLIALNELGKLYSGRLPKIAAAADAYAKLIEELDDRAAVKLSTADQKKILGDHDEAAAYQKFGLVFLQAKRPELAAKAFRRGLDYDEDDPALPLLLAQTLLASGKNDEALTFVDQFLKRQPQELDGYELQAKILTALKRENEITPKLEEAAKRDPKNVALQYVLADRYRETNQTAKADELEKTLLSTVPTPQAFAVRANSLFKRKLADELVKLIDKAVTRPGGREALREAFASVVEEPAFAARVISAGRVLMESDPPQIGTPTVQILAGIANGSNNFEAFLPVQRLQLKRDQTPLSYKDLIQVLTRLRKFGEAASSTEEMLTRFPAERNPQMLKLLVIYYRLAGKPQEAMAAARDAVKFAPNDADLQIQYALTLSSQGKLDEAVGLLTETATREPNNPEVALTLSELLAESGKNDKAVSLIKSVLERNPQNNEIVRLARSRLSVLYVNQGDFAKGEAELETLYERDPEDAGVNNDLGYLYAEQGKNLEKAEAMIRKAVLEEPDNSSYLDSLGWVLFKRGKAKEALEPLEKAAKKLVETTASDATVYEHLGDVYFQLHDPAKAKAAWQDAVKAANKATPPDKRLPEIQKKLDSLDKLGQRPMPSTGDTP